MTPLFPARRAAEEFDQALGGAAGSAVTDRYAELLDTVSVLRAQPVVLPRAEFVGDLRSRLMTAAETELVAAPAVVRQLRPARTVHTNRRIGSVAAALVIVGGSAGMAAAASGSLPGEALYPVKRGVEQVNAAVRFGDAAKGRVLLDQAATRLDEVRELQAQGSSADPSLIAAALDSFKDAADAGADRLFTAYQANGNTQDITSVRSFTTAQMADVASLSKTAPAHDDGLVDAADTLADIDQQARVLCAACSPAAALTPPPAVAAGAAAATLDNLLTRPVTQATADIARATADRDARLARLQAAAQQSAGTIPTAQQVAQAVADAKAEAQAQAGSASGATSPPVSSTLTKDGTLVPAITTGVTAANGAVKDLVKGLTTTVNGVTTSVTGGKTPLDPVVKGLTDTVDGTVGGLLPTH